jgi:hypothetical protein
MHVLQGFCCFEDGKGFAVETSGCQAEAFGLVIFKSLKGILKRAKCTMISKVVFCHLVYMSDGEGEGYSGLRQCFTNDSLPVA